MAITHFTPQLIGRTDGRSAVLSAAYRHCARMEYEREGRIVDYSTKKNLAHEEFLLPPDAPKWVRALVNGRSVAEASEAFWNKVEAFEKRADAQFAKEFIVALPVELTTEQNIALVREFVTEQMLSRGLVADWVYHNEPGNPHIHVMTSLRPLTEQGFGTKTVTVLDEDGRPQRNDAGKIVYRLWAGEKEQFLEQRQGWLDLQNRYLALCGFDIRVDGRSYAERGLDIVPTVHIGVGAKAIMRKAKFLGWSPRLERFALHEKQQEINAERIRHRPEIILDLITSEKSVFDERDVAKILHRYVNDNEVFQQLMARVLQSHETLTIERDGIDFATGEKIRARFTTRALIRIEAELARRSLWLSTETRRGINATIVESVFGRQDQLSDEQKNAIEHVTGESRIAAVVGRAGTGKTTMMKVATEVWERSGFHVIGGALAGKAAEGLEEGSGIRSRTLASWELSWREGRDTPDKNTVFVLDEAGMVASRQMAVFLEAIVKSGAKLVLIGDPEQLQPIEAGAAFRAIVERIGYVELETVHRQREVWMREASLDLSRGRIGKALSAYRAQGRVRASELKGQAVDRLISDWINEYDPTKSTLILGHLRRDVRMLNERARAELVSRGIVGEGHMFRTEEGGRYFDKGDQIVFLKNDTALGVRNGMIGRVVEAAIDRITVEYGEDNDRRRIVVGADSYRNIDYGYATTVHKSQGATVDRVKVLATLSLDRHLTYVAMTRHREDVALYYGSRSFSLAGGLIPLLSRRRSKEITLDYEQGKLYREALQFAERRGMNILRVARALVRGRLDWMLRQREKLVGFSARLQTIGARLGILAPRTTHVFTEDKPMVAGVRAFSKSLEEVIEQKLATEPAVTKQWEEVTFRLQLVFADPEGALRAMRFDAVLNDPAVAKRTLERLENDPASINPLKGKVGLLVSAADKEARRIAEVNVPALKWSIERYLKLRQNVARKISMAEKDERRRLGLDIPALSLTARSILEKFRDAIDRNDLPAALGYAIADREARAEIDAFNKAIAERFGERSLLAPAAREPSGAAFDKAAEGLSPTERESLRQAWPLMRSAQQLAAHERTAEQLQQTETLRQSPHQKPVLKP